MSITRDFFAYSILEFSSSDTKAFFLQTKKRNLSFLLYNRKTVNGKRKCISVCHNILSCTYLISSINVLSLLIYLSFLHPIIYHWEYSGLVNVSYYLIQHYPNEYPQLVSNTPFKNLEIKRNKAYLLLTSSLVCHAAKRALYVCKVTKQHFT